MGTMLELLFDKPGTAPPEVAILMPVRNGERTVAAAVDSALAQTGCHAEILISDDCSEDGTLAASIVVARAYTGPHACRVFRTKQRLYVDHTLNLVESASAPFLVIAHGDDISAPHRASRLLSIHRETGASLISCRALLNDGMTKTLDPLPISGVSGWVPCAEIMPKGQGVLVGFKYGFDRQIYTRFPRLDLHYAPIYHDRLTPFRALLLGGVWYENEVLLERGLHSGQWNKQIRDQRSPASNEFGIALIRLAHIPVMRKDLAHAVAHGLIGSESGAVIATALDAAFAEYLEQMLAARGVLNRNLMVPVWVHMDELGFANCNGGPLGLVPGLSRRSVFDANGNWEVDNSSKILLGSLPIEVGPEGRKFVWVGQDAEIALIKGQAGVLRVVGTVPFAMHRECNAVERVVIDVAAEDRLLGEIVATKERCFNEVFDIGPVPANKDGTVTVRLHCNSVRAPTGADPRAVSVMINRIGLETIIVGGGYAS